MGNSWEFYFTIAWLSLWLGFPIGMFLSVSHVDKNTDQVIDMEEHKHFSEPPKPAPKVVKVEEGRSRDQGWDLDYGKGLRH